ncbi:hypothetical protein SPACI_045220 [Sporomusa acidovorans DSM 3132]|uniref:Transposase InsH N-terminal domain-containing protein n=1 Tax=Sporomusa acidovorans (strain ATCC 49682 / DSM 3132 / Mol) TaxID=1123286 RepID=A0ABZ3J932_SPOA4|nr:hypothetical protein SPACI_41550 [Sporomusa acidovorans DSM 3132]SDE06232.1 hypothetical protein SAMN04488499_100767 [Sporomusa acidovorans]
MVKGIPAEAKVLPTPFAGLVLNKYLTVTRFLDPVGALYCLQENKLPAGKRLWSAHNRFIFLYSIQQVLAKCKPITRGETILTLRQINIFIGFDIAEISLGKYPG